MEEIGFAGLNDTEMDTKSNPIDSTSTLSLQTPAPGTAPTAHAENNPDLMDD